MQHAHTNMKTSIHHKHLQQSKIKSNTISLQIQKYDNQNYKPGYKMWIVSWNVIMSTVLGNHFPHNHSNIRWREMATEGTHRNKKIQVNQ